MRLLLDQNISHRVIKKIRNYYPDAESVKQNGLIDKDDSEIRAFARENDLVVVTFDEDFYNLNLIYGPPPKVIWFRTGNLTNDELADVLMHHKETIDSFMIDQGALQTGCLEIY